MKTMDFKTICRFCLESKKLSHDIYNTYYAEKKLLYCEMISNCTKLKPMEKDGLPRLICKDCSLKLKRTFAFNEQCENSEKTLKTWLHTSIGENLTSDEHDKNENREPHELNIINNKDDESAFHDHDDCWDSEDDNMILLQIKLNKTLTESFHNDNNIESQDTDWDCKTNNTTESSTTNVVKVSDDKLEKGKSKKSNVNKKQAAAVHQCDVCGKFLSTKSNLKAHKICHTSLRPFKCEKCPAAYRGYSALSQHRRHTHLSYMKYQCDYCSKTFRRRPTFVQHIRAHTGEKLHNCTICFKSFVQKAQLTTHMRRHTGDMEYLCQECGKGFPVKSDLIVHLRTHNGEKPYSCRFCKKTFSTSGSLNIHERIHNKDMKYKCPQCERGFVTYSSYKVHVKRHKGQRDYRCDCGKSFYTSNALKQHGIVHSGLKRYQCKFCQRRFGQQSHLTRHFRSDHAPPDEPLPLLDHYRIVLSDDDAQPRAPRRARPPRAPRRARPPRAPRRPALPATPAPDIKTKRL